MPSRLRTLGIVIATGLQKLSLNPEDSENLDNQNPHPITDGGNLFGIRSNEDIELTEFQTIDVTSLNGEDNQDTSLLPSETIPSNITEENNIIEGTAYKIEPISEQESSIIEPTESVVDEEDMNKKQSKINVNINVDTTVPEQNDTLLIKEDIFDISKTEENIVINDQHLAELNSIAAQEDAMLEEQLGDIGPASSNPEAPVTADMRRKRTEQKLAKQRADNEIRELKAKINELEQDLSMMTEELTVTEQANLELTAKLNTTNRDLKNAQQGISSDSDTAFELLASAGVPSELPDGSDMSIADAIMYLLDQDSIISSTMSTLRNDLRKLAYKWRREGRNDDASYMFDVLAASSKQGSFIAVSSEQE
mgnify:CR=1 FL=1